CEIYPCNELRNGLLRRQAGNQEAALTSSLPNKPWSSRNALLLKALETEKAFEPYSYDFGQVPSRSSPLLQHPWALLPDGPKRLCEKTASHFRRGKCWHLSIAPRTQGISPLGR